MYVHSDLIRSMLEIKDIPERTTCCLLVDKELIQWRYRCIHFFENATGELLELMEGRDLALGTLAHSAMLSSDVRNVDPSFASAFEKKNVAYLGNGMVINKYTGVHGKRASNDANAEYIACIRSIFDKEKINFQTAELGKVDLGGRCDSVYHGAVRNECDRQRVLSMHSTMGCTSKVDIYETKGICRILKRLRDVTGLISMEELRKTDFYYDLPKDL